MRSVVLLLIVSCLVVAGLTGCYRARSIAAEDELSGPRAQPVALVQENVRDRANADETVELAPLGTAPANRPVVMQPTGAVPNFCDCCDRKCWNPCCGLPCEQCMHNWKVRGLGGVALWTGDEKPNDTRAFWGFDVGHTWCCCPCWGVDLYYRTVCAEFDRQFPTGLGTDTGTFHFFGAKVNFERSICCSRWYWYAGLGAGGFTTQNYVEDDTGFHFLAEAGVGFVVNRWWRVFAGVNIIGMSTKAGRLLPVDDTERRWQTLFAPVAGIEVNF